MWCEESARLTGKVSIEGYINLRGIMTSSLMFHTEVGQRLWKVLISNEQHRT